MILQKEIPLTLFAEFLEQFRKKITEVLWEEFSKILWEEFPEVHWGIPDYASAELSKLLVETLWGVPDR